MPPRQDGSVTIQNAQIRFRNFKGRETDYNREGSRNFIVLLDDDIAAQLVADGWNVKTLKPRELDDGEIQPGTPYIQVEVGFAARPPQIVMITSRNRTNLTEQECEMLDWVEIENVDLSFRPYHWNVGNKTGIKAYLKAIYVTIYEDELAQKYADIPDSSALRKDFDE